MRAMIFVTVALVALVAAVGLADESTTVSYDEPINNATKQYTTETYYKAAPVTVEPAVNRSEEVPAQRNDEPSSVEEQRPMILTQRIRAAAMLARNSTKSAAGAAATNSTGAAML